MEKYLYLTSNEYAVLLHLTGSKTVTGFSIEFPEDVLVKRKLLFDMYRKGIVFNNGNGFSVSEEWQEVFGTIMRAQNVLWISFAEAEKPDILFYLCGEYAVRVENLTDAGHDLYRVSMRRAGDWQSELAEGELFPAVRTQQTAGELMDSRLGVPDDGEAETIVTFALCRNGTGEVVERATLEKDHLIYYMKYEAEERSVRRRAHKNEIAETLGRYLGVKQA